MRFIHIPLIILFGISTFSAHASLFREVTPLVNAGQMPSQILVAKNERGGIPGSNGFDSIPNLSDMTEIEIFGSGTWSEIFGSCNCPSLSSAKRIELVDGAQVVYDCQDHHTIKSITINDGTSLTFDPNTDTRMLVGTLFLKGGLLSIEPVGARVEIWWDDVIDVVEDPREWMLGLVAVDGEVSIIGTTDKTNYVSALPIVGGNNTVELTQPALNWAVGDTVYFQPNKILEEFNAPPHGHWKRGQDNGMQLPREAIPFEYATIQDINETVLTLDRNLAFDHDPAYVANMARSIKFNSTLQGGFRADGLNRGHMAFLGDDVDGTVVNISGAEFKHMGRTRNALFNHRVLDPSGQFVPLIPDTNGDPAIPFNRIARYIIHSHQQKGPITVSHNAIYCDDNVNLVGDENEFRTKNGIANHGTPYMIAVENNVIGCAGSGIFMSEDGNEGGLFERNFAISHGYNAGIFTNVISRGGTLIVDESALIPTRAYIGPDRGTLTDEQVKQLPRPFGGFGSPLWCRTHDYLEINDNFVGGVNLLSSVACFSHLFRMPLGVPAGAGRPPHIQVLVDERNNARGAAFGFISFKGNMIVACGAMIQTSYGGGTNVIDGMYMRGLCRSELRSLMQTHTTPVLVINSTLMGASFKVVGHGSR